MYTESDRLIGLLREGLEELYIRLNGINQQIDILANQEANAAKAGVRGITDKYLVKKDQLLGQSTKILDQMQDISIKLGQLFEERPPPK